MFKIDTQAYLTKKKGGKIVQNVREEWEDFVYRAKFEGFFVLEGLSTVDEIPITFGLAGQKQKVFEKAISFVSETIGFIPIHDEEFIREEMDH